MFLSKFEQKFEQFFSVSEYSELSGFSQNWPVFEIFFDIIYIMLWFALIDLKAIRLLLDYYIFGAIEI